MLRMLRNPTSPGPAPLTRMLALFLLFALFLLSAQPLIPALRWVLALL